MKIFIFLFFSLFLIESSAQVVFLETFDEADDAITGIDNSGGAVAWTTTCPGALDVNDYLKVLSGVLEAKDTNGPAAYWETDDIDITPCTGLLVTVDIAEVGDLEACADCGGTGTNCVDWLKIEYNLDGLGWTEIVGTTCALAASPGEMIVIGDIPGDAFTYNSPCLDFGSTLALRITCSCWAADELWRIDNISVTCFDCILPIELLKFEAIQVNNTAVISWGMDRINEIDFFQIERSFNGMEFELVNTTNTTELSDSETYQFTDVELPNSGLVYYRLNTVDLNGKSVVSEVITLQMQPVTNLKYVDNQIVLKTNDSEPTEYTIFIYSLNGQLLDQIRVKNNESINWNRKGFFLIEIPELNYMQKLAVN